MEILFGLKKNMNISALFVCVLPFCLVLLVLFVCVRSAGFWKQVDYVGAEGFTVGAE